MMDDTSKALRMARAEALEDAANLVEKFQGWGLGWDNCTKKVAAEIRALAKREDTVTGQ